MLNNIVKQLVEYVIIYEAINEMNKNSYMEYINKYILSGKFRKRKFSVNIFGTTN